jgi:hypothetical protein
LPVIDGVAAQAIGPPDGIDAHSKAAREAVERIAPLNVVHGPAQRWTTGVGRWRWADIVGRREVDLLPRIYGRRAQAIGLHERIGAGTTSPRQTGERVPISDSVDDPIRRP